MMDKSEMTGQAGKSTGTSRERPAGQRFRSLAERRLTRRQFVVGAATAGVAASSLGSVLLAACGGNGEGTGGPLKVGTVAPLTGPYAGDGFHMHNAVTLAVEDWNAKGGVLGRELELVSYDIGDMTSEKLIAAADKLVMSEGVVAVCAGYAGMGPDIPAFGKYDVPFICDDATSNVTKLIQEHYDEYKNVFMDCVYDEAAWGREDYLAFMELTSTYAEDGPYNWPNKDLVVFTSDFEWDLRVSKGFADEAKKNGWRIVSTDVFPGGTNEWGALLAKLRNANPGALYFACQDPTSAVSFWQQFLRNPSQSIVNFGCTLWWTGVLETLGEDANGLTGWITQEPLFIEGDPEGLNFKKRYEERFGEPPAGSWVYAYDSIGIWASAAEEAGDATDYEKVIQAIIDKPHQGAGGKFLFVPELGNTIAPGVHQPNLYGQVQRGEKKSVESFNRILITAPYEYREQPPWATPEFEAYPWPYYKGDAWKVPGWIKPS